MGLTATGMGSGLDINGIVSALVGASFTPREATLNAQEGKLQTQISAFGSLKSAVSEFQSTLEKLQEPDDYDKRTTSTNKSDYLSVSAESKATAGSYNVVVSELAESHKVGSKPVADAEDPIGEGSLTITAGVDEDGEPLSLTLEIGAEESLDDLVKRINESEDNPGVTATIVTGEAGPQLVMTSDKTGTDNTISITATDADGSTALSDTFGTMETLVEASNAKLTIDGIAVESQSNEVKDAIDGVTLDLKDADPDETTKITITESSSSAKGLLEDFVEAYNSMQEAISNVSGYNAETESAGALQGDSLPRSITSQFRNAISEGLDFGDGTTGSLSQFGIAFDRYGKLEIDDDKLDTALEENMGGLIHAFTTEDTGFAYKLDALADVFVGGGEHEGLLNSKNDSLQGQLDRISDDREVLARQQASYEERLFQQYNSMDSVVSQLNNQAAGLYGMLDSLPGLIR